MQCLETRVRKVLDSNRQGSGFCQALLWLLAGFGGMAVLGRAGLGFFLERLIKCHAPREGPEKAAVPSQELWATGRIFGQKFDTSRLIRVVSLSIPFKNENVGFVDLPAVLKTQTVFRK